jgi:hypothetical protein
LRFVRRRSCAEKPADRHRRRSSRRQRPCNRDAAAKSDYFPSPHGFARAKDYIGYKQNIIFLDREAAGRYTKGDVARIEAASSKKIPRVIKRHHNHDQARKKSIEFSRLRLAAFSFASGLFSTICRLVFLRIACFGS